jgi:hypothetical protein
MQSGLAHGKVSVVRAVVRFHVARQDVLQARNGLKGDQTAFGLALKRTRRRMLSGVWMTEWTKPSLSCSVSRMTFLSHDRADLSQGAEASSDA